MKCLTFEIFTHKTPNPRWGGVGLIFCYYFSRQFMTFPGLLIFWPPKFPLRPPLVGPPLDNKLLSIFSTVHEIYRTFEIWTPNPPPGTPPRVGWVKTNCIDFLDSSWHFPDFWFFDPLKFPLRPPLVGGGVNFFYRFSRQFMKFTGLLKCWPPTPPPPGTPTPGGMGKNKFIDFLDSSWHFPDFWFFDPLKFPLRPPPPLGGEVIFFR